MAVVQRAAKGLPPTTTICADVSGSTPPTGASLSQMNSFKITAVLGRISSHFLPDNCSDSSELYGLLLNLARGIDYAIVNNDIPARALELPSLLKKIHYSKNDAQLQAAVMVLMMSVKNACKSGWFSRQDCDELLTLANKMARSFCSPEGINIGPSSLPQVISDVKSRFLPRMKIGNVLTSLKVKPGFGAFAVDFHILNDKVPVPQKKIGLFVIQTDNISTSTCLISPPKVNFLLNGKEVDRRTDSAMDTEPQLPTDVTRLLKYGTNLLQTIGQFSGNYIVAIAFATMIRSSDMPALQEYVSPIAAKVEPDSEMIEGSSRISLNCPITLTRIINPVKGERCRHHQCFDFQNYIEINSRKPSWRCPHCNQSISYLDIRIDQYMVKVLNEVVGNVVDVLVSEDGSWKPVMESDDHTGGRNNMHRPDRDGLKNMKTNFVDPTKEDGEENNVMGAGENEERKPLKDFPPGFLVTRSKSEAAPALCTSESSKVPANHRGSHNTDQLSMTSVMPHSLSQPLSVQTSTYGRSVDSGHWSTQVSRTLPAAPVQLQAPRTGSSIPMNAERVGASLGEQGVMDMGSDFMNESPSDQNWRPTGRMRGSITGRAISAALDQFIIRPTVSGQAPIQTPDMPSSPLDSQSQMQVQIANNINTHERGPSQAYTRTGDSTGSLGNFQQRH